MVRTERPFDELDSHLIEADRCLGNDLDEAIDRLEGALRELPFDEVDS